MLHTREALISAVERSPEYVALHDRERWLALFAAEGAVEDPVGSPPAPKATGRLGKFWDTFIGPNEIAFEVKGDHIIGRDVFRDVVIHTRIGGKIELAVDAYLLYQLDSDGGDLQVTRLSAHWNLARQSLDALKLGPRAWVEVTKQFTRMITRMGLPWVGGYLASLWNGIGGRGLRAARQLAEAASAGDASGLGDLLADDGVVFELGAAELSPRALCDRLAGGRLRIDSPVAAGWTTSFRFAFEGAARAEGLARLEFDPGSRRIRRARFFVA